MEGTGFSNKLSVRLSLTLIIIVLVVSLTNFPWISEQLKMRLEWDLADKARVATSLFLETRSFLAESYIHDNSTIDSEGLSDFSHFNISVAESAVKKIFEEESWLFDEIWLNKSQSGFLPEPQSILLEELINDSKAQETWDVRMTERGKMFYYLTPVRVDESCLTCHSNENNLIFTQKVPSYSLNELVGAVSLQIPMFALNQTIKMEIILQMVFIVLVLVLIALAVFIFVQRSVEQPLNELVLVAQKFGQGHLDIPFPEINAPSEIKLLAEQWFAMAERLKGFYADLENQVKERTLKLREANQILEGQKKELEEANKIKSEFLASVSHELRTPLTSIIAFVELLLEGIGGPINEQQREYLESALRGGHRLEDSINDLLDMAKIEAGKMSLYCTYFSLEDLITELSNRIHSLILTKNIDFKVELAEDVGKIYGDREKVERILLNLISNAIKFTPSGGKVLVKAKTDAQGLIVQVKDTGLGIKKEYHKCIFDAFRQVDGSTTRAYKGTGLGLAIAKKYVDLHGGFIWVESDFAKGSAFYFTIPKKLEETEVEKGGEEENFSSGR